MIGQNDELAKIAIENALNISIAHPFVGLVVTRGEDFSGALILNNFDRHNIDMTVLATGNWSMSDVRNIARYIFDQLDCKRITSVTLANNKKAIHRLQILGFKREGCLRERFPQGDAIAFGLLRSEQKLTRLSK